VTPRGTDWTLAALIALLGVTGGLVPFAGATSDAWVYAAPGTAGVAAVRLVAPG
jgi:hypothetical protein